MSHPSAPPPPHFGNCIPLDQLKPRPKRGDQPIAIDNTPVHCRGDALGKVLWRGRQWAVTEDGIECLDGCYFIKKAELARDLDVYPAPVHMAEKEWVDPDEFATAYLVALSLHGVRDKRNTPANLRTMIARTPLASSGSNEQ